MMEKVFLRIEKKTGDDRTFTFPVLPEKLEISGDAGNESVDTIKLGEVTVTGERKLRRFDIDAFFTANEEAPFCRTKGEDYRTPEECVRFVQSVLDEKEPVMFIAEGLDLDAFWVTIESFRWTYGTTGDIDFSISFKEYRPFGQKAKSLDRPPDLFGDGDARRLRESPGQAREPKGWAIGDRAIVSGTYYSSPNGAAAMLGDMTDMPKRYMERPWSAPLEAAYRAMSEGVAPLRAHCAVIIDIVKTATAYDPASGIAMTVKSPCGYCIADAATKARIGWVAEDQMTRA